MIVSKFLDKTPRLYLEVFILITPKKILFCTCKKERIHTNTQSRLSVRSRFLFLFFFRFFKFFCGGEKLDKKLKPSFFLRRKRYAKRRSKPSSQQEQVMVFTACLSLKKDVIFLVDFEDLGMRVVR